MDRGRGRNFATRGRNSAKQSWIPRRPDSGGVDVNSPATLGTDDQNNNERQKSLRKSSNNNTKKVKYRPKEPEVISCQQEQSSHDIAEFVSHTEKLPLGKNLCEPFSSKQLESVSSSEPKVEDNLSSVSSYTGIEDVDLNGKTHNLHISENESSILKSNIPESDIFAREIPDVSPEVIKPGHQDAITVSRKATANTSAVTPVFDICSSNVPGLVKLKEPLHKQKQRERHLVEAKKHVLGPGIVLLKQYLSCAEQVSIIKKCRDLGVGAGGFYQPVFADGGKMQLNMMCLGKNWEPENGMYGSKRLLDGAMPPAIPCEFCQLVKSAIRDSHSNIEQETDPLKADQLFPSMTPDICIVNFYKTSGRLGLHQDKDESPRSIEKGLPVVSFSIGDSADFLYGDDRDTDKAKVVELQSGDVLIFGGKSRRIFHGVTTIHPNSAPKNLINDSNLSPGRLNLTFREY